MRPQARAPHSFRRAWVAFRAESGARHESRPAARDAWRPVVPPQVPSGTGRLDNCDVHHGSCHLHKYIQVVRYKRGPGQRVGRKARPRGRLLSVLAPCPEKVARAPNPQLNSRGPPSTGHAQQGRYRHPAGSGEQQSKIGALAQARPSQAALAVPGRPAQRRPAPSRMRRLLSLLFLAPAALAPWDPGAWRAQGPSSSLGPPLHALRCSARPPPESLCRLGPGPARGASP